MLTPQGDKPLIAEQVEALKRPSRKDSIRLQKADSLENYLERNNCKEDFINLAEPDHESASWIRLHKINTKDTQFLFCTLVDRLKSTENCSGQAEPSRAERFVLNSTTQLDRLL